MVLEAQGGMSSECSATLHRIAAVVAAAEYRSTSSVREEMFQRLALIRARCSHAALARRRQEAANGRVGDLLRATLSSSLLVEADDDDSMQGGDGAATAPAGAQ